MIRLLYTAMCQPVASKGGVRNTFFRIVGWLTRFWARHLSRRSARPYSYIEPGVRPLVEILNTVEGVKTIGSCEGHFSGGPPYIYFKAPMHFARRLEKLLRDDLENEKPLLSSRWVMEGHFDGDFTLTFMLYCPRYHRTLYEVYGDLWLFGVHRKRVDRELLVLANFVEQIVNFDI